MGSELLVDKNYKKTEEKQPILVVDLNKLIEDISVFVKDVKIVNGV